MSGFEISLGALPLLYLIVVFLTPIKFDMNILIVVCAFTLLLGLIEVIGTFAKRKK